MTIPELHKIFLAHPSVCTDTRKITNGSIFFALKGDNFNGNKFAATAIEKGCAFAIIDEKEFFINEKTILVEDVLLCLQSLANYHRKFWGKQVIGLTGSNGKTTTKELTFAVLKQKFNCLATEGNLNNHIGVPLTLLQLNKSHDLAIVEMGANHQKEIEQLCKIAEPDFGIITNIGKAHLEGFGGEAGVLKGKAELFDYLRTKNATIFINGDDDKLKSVAQNLNQVSYGYSSSNNFVGNLEGASLLLEIGINHNGQTTKIHSKLTGSYNGLNLLAAFAIGNYFGLNNDEIKKGIEGFEPDNNRSQIKNTSKNILILDAYNANPSSMLLALDNLIRINADKKYFILGEMREMGNYAEAEHKSIFEYAIKTGIPGAFIGKEFLKLKIADNNYHFFNDSLEAKIYFQEHPIQGCTILIKGSRGVKLEEIKPVL